METNEEQPHPAPPPPPPPLSVAEPATTESLPPLITGYEPHPKPFPGFWQAIALLAIFFGIQVLGAIAVYIMAPKGLSGTEALKDWRSLWILAFVNLVAFGMAVWVGIRWSGDSWRERLPLGKFPAQLAGPFITTSFGMLITAGAVAIASIVIISHSPFRDWATTSRLPKGGIAATLFLLCIVAPLTEETLFRGLILGGFLKRYSQRTALLASSALFGLMHLTPLQILPTFLIGLLLGWWRIQTGGIQASIFGHAIHNGFLGLLILAGTSSRAAADQSASAASKLQVVPALIGSAVALAIGLTILIGGMNRAKEALASSESSTGPLPIQEDFPTTG